MIFKFFQAKLFRAHLASRPFVNPSIPKNLYMGTIAVAQWTYGTLDQLDWYKMNIQYHYVLGRFSWCSYHWQILPIYTDHSGELIWKSCGNSVYIRVGSTSGGHIPLPEKYAVIMMNKNRDFEKATFFFYFRDILLIDEAISKAAQVSFKGFLTQKDLLYQLITY